MLTAFTYTSAGNIASAHRANAEFVRRRYQQDLAEISEVLPEFVHEANLGALPLSPFLIAWKAEQIGLIDNASRIVVGAGYCR